MADATLYRSALLEYLWPEIIDVGQTLTVHSEHVHHDINS